MVPASLILNGSVGQLFLSSGLKNPGSINIFLITVFNVHTVAPGTFAETEIIFLDEHSHFLGKQTRAIGQELHILIPCALLH